MTEDCGDLSLGKYAIISSNANTQIVQTKKTLTCDCIPLKKERKENIDNANLNLGEG